jgi:hypothetical protein
MTTDLAALLLDPPTGALPRSVSVVTRSGLCAVLAPAAARLSPGASRRGVARQALARQRLLEALMPCGPVLPVAPGTRLTAREVGALLEANAADLETWLRDLDGLWQYQCVLSWDEPRVLSRFADTPELAPVLAEGRIAGHALARAVGALAERLAGEAASALAAVARDLVALPREGGTLLNVALLLEAGREGDLDAALRRIDGVWTEGLRIRLIGPGPAVSFATLNVREVTAEEAAAAAARLGLRDAHADAPLADLRREALRRGVARPGEIDAACATLKVLRSAPPGGPVILAGIQREAGVAPTRLARVA